MERIDGKLKARILDETELLEHRQNIDQAKGQLRSLPKVQAPDAAGTPDIPKPEGPPSG